ncbi:DUF192 domain-containing protein [Sphingomonas solaris]|uniref:DUF192 domain-containing protein n=1 Tax=Alterirhizorhabdus solaris TaxID=2529389 RepID=A0A558R2X3_9SPHN|nr:DUF192 domain-containing protein [Sphingomonas solaris]
MALLAGCNAPARTVASPPPGPASPAAAPIAARVPLFIRTAKGERRFTIEVARTPGEQEHGLMFRERLDPDGGMIFPFSPPRPASFWMRNTVIPLDLIFIRADGRIARIAADAKPYSLDLIESGEPVAAVLEIAGGRAAELGIAAGDIVRWPG